MNKTKSLRLAGLGLLVILAFGAAQAQIANPNDNADTAIATLTRPIGSSTRAEDSEANFAIIKNLVEAETKFRDTLIHFSFKRDVTLQTIGPDGAVTGEYIRNSVFVLDDRGRRIERVLFHPKSTITEMSITKEDIQDLAGSQLFGIELSDLNSYNLSYLGEESLNGKRVHLVQVTPAVEPDPNHMRIRFFVGRVWVDAETFQPLKLEGITQPEGKQRFPAFTTERNTTVESFFFPSHTFADVVLHFPTKDVHYRVKVRYYDFRRFASTVKIVEID
jgi:hypothetical protein